MHEQRSFFLFVAPVSTPVPSRGSTMIEARRLCAALATCIALASCATTSPLRYPQPLEATQQLVLRTDPAGATCSILRDGAVVASIEATPGVATVRRDFCPLPFHFLSTPFYCIGPLERIAPIEVVCHKERYLDQRRTFIVTDASIVQSEEGPQSEPSAGSQMARGLTEGLTLFGKMGGPLGVLILAPTALAVGIANVDQPASYAYAYRALPDFFLTPATFDSESTREAFFATLETKLVGAAAAQHAYINAQCHYWPCVAKDSAPCPDPVCQQRHARVDDQLKNLLDEIPALRAQLRIVAPSE